MKKTIATLLSIWTAAGPALPDLSYAGAREPSVVFGQVASSPEDISRARAIRPMISKALAQSSKAKMVSDADFAKWQQRTSPPKKVSKSDLELRQARELLVEGKRNYDNLKFKEATAALEESRRLFILNLPGLRTNRDLIDAHLYLGMSYVVSGGAENAAEEFRRVIYLDPRRQLSSREFSPKIREAFAKAKQEVMLADSVRLGIQSDPPGEIFLNGRAIGQSPKEMILQPGEYFLLIEKDGSEPWYRPVKLSRRLEYVEAKLKPSQAQLERTDFYRIREKGADAGDLAQLVDLAESVGADLILLSELRMEGEPRLFGQFFDARTQEFSQVAVATLDPDFGDAPSAAIGVVEALTEMIRTDGYLEAPGRPNLTFPKEGLTVGAADRPEEGGLSAVPEKPWYLKWWAWPILAGVGTAVFLGARQVSNSNDAAKIVIDNRGNF